MSYALARQNGTQIDGGQVFRIPVDLLPKLGKKVEQINKKATKLAKPPVTLTLTDEFETIETHVGGQIGRRLGAAKLTYKTQYVIVKGDTPVIEGWQFVAIIRHKRTGNEFVQVPQAFTHLTDKDNIELASYVFAGRNCDHCNMNRVRNATYLLRNADTGEFKQVGSACLGDFTGYSDPQAAAKACENIFKLFIDVQNWEREIPRTIKTFFVEEWMSFVAQSIRIDGGWASRGNAGYNSTADKAKTRIIGFAQGDDTILPPNDQDFEKAREVIQWVRDYTLSDEDKGDFMKNLKAAMVDDDGLTEFDMGVTAAAFIAMWKRQAEDAKKLTQVEQEYFGTKGERVNRMLTLIRKSREIAGDYGAYAYITFRDDKGRVYTATANCKVTRELKEQGRYTVRGTITRHAVDTYSGDKTTYLNRIKVEAS